MEVLLDGKVICRAGDDELDLLTATLYLLPGFPDRRLVVADQLEKRTQGKLQRWLDMSLLDGAVVSLRIVDVHAVPMRRKMSITSGLCRP